jgi:hypothetical protein
VSFAEPGGQDQNLFQNSLGRQAGRKWVAGEFNGYLSGAK